MNIQQPEGLKPCPLCGADAFLVCVSPPEAYLQQNIIVCGGCIIRTQEMQDTHKLIEQWNQQTRFRSEDKIGSDLPARLEVARQTE